MELIIDQFNEENFEIPEENLEVLPTTFSEIKKAYPLLGTLESWAWGEQSARQDGTIISRAYKELEFYDDAEDFDLVDNTFVDSTYGSRYYWRVIYKFDEYEYYSEAGPDYENFKIWEYNLHSNQLEIIYKHEILASISWERPIISTNNQEDSLTIEYEPLPLPFILSYDVGKALGATIDFNLMPDYILFTDDILDISLLSEEELNKLNKIDIAENNYENPYKLDKRYITLVWLEPTDDLPNLGIIDFYGVENYRTFFPLTREEDPELLVHLEETPYIAHTNNTTTITKYKPPGRLDFPDHFWNDTMINKINKFKERTNEPQIITN